MDKPPDMWVGAAVRYTGAEKGILRTGLQGTVVQTGADRSTAYLMAGRRARLRRHQARVALADGQVVVADAADLAITTPPHPLRAEPDGRTADWVLQALRPWTPGGEVLPAACFVPDTYASVVKVLHPWTASDGNGSASWAHVAGKAGLPSVQALDSTRSAQGPPAVQGWELPPPGQMPTAVGSAVIEVLAGFTTTPEDVVVGVWTGWGGLPYSRFPGAAVVPTEARGHVLLRGPLAGLGEPLSPTASALETSGLWWPADRGWLVSTEVDFDWTFVAGSAEIAAALDAHPGLEVLHTDVEAPANNLRGDRPM
ncbi:hypothetical protein BH23ACT9_BH23ACT9_24260 [soil metagenome]